MCLFYIQVPSLHRPQTHIERFLGEVIKFVSHIGIDTPSDLSFGSHIYQSAREHEQEHHPCQSKSGMQ